MPMANCSVVLATALQTNVEPPFVLVWREEPRHWIKPATPFALGVVFLQRRMLAFDPFPNNRQGPLFNSGRVRL